MFNIGMSELVLILIIALVVFGPGKLPEVSKALGKSLQEFRKAASDVNGNSTEEKKTQTIDVDKVEVKTEANTETKSEEKK